MFGFLGDLLVFPLRAIELWLSAIAMSPEAFLRAATSGEARSAALLIAFLAGVSEMLGQSVILVVNRVALYRFIASLLFTGASYLLTAFTWAASAFLIAPLTAGASITAAALPSVIGVVALAFAPRVFGVFSLAPYFGAALGNVLEVWAMVLVMFGLAAATSLPIHAAIICGGAGWVVSYAFRAFLGRTLAKPLGKLRLAIVGSPLDRSPQQIIDELLANLKPGDKA